MQCNVNCGATVCCCLDGSRGTAEQLLFAWAGLNMSDLAVVPVCYACAVSDATSSMMYLKPLDWHPIPVGRFVPDW